MDLFYEITRLYKFKPCTDVMKKKKKRGGRVGDAKQMFYLGKNEKAMEIVFFFMN